ncbi:hypothetical protein D9M68_379570 [compost metagenome]
MTIKGKAYIVGAYEPPTRKAPDKTVAQLHATGQVLAGQRRSPCPHLHAGLTSPPYPLD